MKSSGWPMGSENSCRIDRHRISAWLLLLRVHPRGGAMGAKCLWHWTWSGCSTARCV